MNLEKIKNLNIPTTSGCYQFRDKDKKIIYIGKAINLRNRVKSYWQKKTTHTPAKYAMIKQVADISWIETESEIEALLLEANLVKKYQPHFNIMLRDDKRFTYIKISTEETWSRIFVTRKIDQSGRYFGPFTSAEAVHETLKTIRKIWPYRSCIRLPKKACLYYRLNKCPGMCEMDVDAHDYKKTIKQISLFLEGKKNQVITEIKKETSKTKNEELKIKNLFKLKNIKKVLEHANIIGLEEKYKADVVELAKVLGLEKVPERIEGYDISNVFGRQAVGSMVVFTDGEPNKNEYRKFKINASENMGDTGMLHEVLERRLEHLEKSKIKNPDFTPPLRDYDEARQKSKLNKKIKKEYWPAADLMVVDGGRGQLNVLVRLLKKNNLDIPVIAISKGAGLRSSRAPDKIFFPGQAKPLELPLSSPAIHIIKRVRDEAHRFAIGYHRKLRRLNP